MGGVIKGKEEHVRFHRLTAIAPAISNAQRFTFAAREENYVIHY